MSQSNPESWHEVVSYDTNDVTCTCGHWTQGNTCKHQVKCLLLSGFTKVRVLQMLGTFMGTSFGGLQGMESRALHQDEVYVGDNCFLINVMAAIDDQHLDDCNTMAKAHVPKSISLQDLHAAVDNIWENVKHSNPLKAQVLMRLQGTCSDIEDLAARAMTQNPPPSDPPSFLAVAGADGSLKRKKDWLETFCGKRKKMRAVVGEGVDIRPPSCKFIGKPKAKAGTMTQELQQQALQTIDMNKLPAVYTKCSLQNYKVSNRTSGCMKET